MKWKEFKKLYKESSKEFKVILISLLGVIFVGFGSLFYCFLLVLYVLLL